MEEATRESLRLKTSEKRLWKTIERPLKRYGMFVRIENTAGVGTPDVFACVRAVSAWVELKQVTGRKVELRPDQVEFLQRLSECGGRGFVLARRHRSIRIWDGRHSKEISRRGGWDGAVPIGEWSPPYAYQEMVESMFGGSGITTADHLIQLTKSADRRRSMLENFGPPRNECPGCFSLIYDGAAEVGWCADCAGGSDVSGR